MVEKFIKAELDSLFIPRIPSTDVPLKKIYAALPYVSEFSNREVKVELNKLNSTKQNSFRFQIN